MCECVSADKGVPAALPHAEAEGISLSGCRGIDITNENHYHYSMEGPRTAGSEVQTQPSLQTGSGTNPHCVTSDQLLGAARELLIMHAGRQYRLRLTQNGKLILTA